jgi:hypothetical protein
MEDVKQIIEKILSKESNTFDVSIQLIKSIENLISIYTKYPNIETKDLVKDTIHFFENLLQKITSNKTE